MFAHNNPLRHRLTEHVISPLVRAGFEMVGAHNQRQSFFRKLESNGKRITQHIEIVENAPSDLVVVYESASQYGDDIEKRVKIEGASILGAVAKAIAHAEDSQIIFSFHGQDALKAA